MDVTVKWILLRDFPNEENDKTAHLTEYIYIYLNDGDTHCFSSVKYILLTLHMKLKR